MTGVNNNRQLLNKMVDKYFKNPSQEIKDLDAKDREDSIWKKDEKGILRHRGGGADIAGDMMAAEIALTKGDLKAAMAWAKELPDDNSIKQQVLAAVKAEDAVKGLKKPEKQDDQALSTAITTAEKQAGLIEQKQKILKKSATDAETAKTKEEEKKKGLETDLSQIEKDIKIAEKQLKETQKEKAKAEKATKEPLENLRAAQEQYNKAIKRYNTNQTNVNDAALCKAQESLEKAKQNAATYQQILDNANAKEQKLTAELTALKGKKDVTMADIKTAEKNIKEFGAKIKTNSKLVAQCKDEVKTLKEKIADGEKELGKREAKRQADYDSLVAQKKELQARQSELIAAADDGDGKTSRKERKSREKLDALDIKLAEVQSQIAGFGGKPDTPAGNSFA
jgi:DNA repair exonuclease SbcCD ATPase subunit